MNFSDDILETDDKNLRYDLSVIVTALLEISKYL